MTLVFKYCVTLSKRFAKLTMVHYFLHVQFVKTILSQGHLTPLPLYVSPVFWAYDYALRIYPVPDVIVFADKYDPFNISNTDCLCINPVGVCLNLDSFLDGYWLVWAANVADLLFHLWCPYLVVTALRHPFVAPADLGSKPPTLLPSLLKPSQGVHGAWCYAVSLRGSWLFYCLTWVSWRLISLGFLWSDSCWCTVLTVLFYCYRGPSQKVALLSRCIIHLIGLLKTGREHSHFFSLLI